jgi:hypothetical protein
MHKIEAAIPAVPDMRLKSPTFKNPAAASPDKIMTAGIP